MNEPITTIVGNVAGEVELRFTPSGAAVANWTVASTPRSFDKQRQEYVDGETLWMRCSIWREAAENVAESLAKGMRVIVTGRLKQRSWEDKNGGGKRTVIEMEVDEVGPSLRFAQATVRKSQRGSSSGGSGGFGGQQQERDPWATPVGAGSQGSGWPEDPPF